MSSLIKGYEYDIFISYRQKDNKADYWVTHFVEALKDELEATFKEDISVYFDENPHDGLLETHDVDQSLKEKIKVPVFIPIISQTYCDPKSFAWQKEFLAFRDFAKNDELGLDIQLDNGNVCKRILPVRIHDIDINDQQLYEAEAGGMIRAIDFIYKEAGVNRPLLPNEEHPDRNTNKATYRNQINKVANAIKEILSGKAGTDQNEDYFSSKIADTPRSHPKKAPENSIVVLPFENMSSDPEQEYFSDGLTEEIITDLSYIEGLMVISRSSAMTFKGSKDTVKKIAKKVNVRYVLEGSVRKARNNLKITAQLIDAENDAHLWADKYSGTLEDIFEIQEKVSQLITDSLKIKLSEEEKEKIKHHQNRDIVALEYWFRAKQELHHYTKESLDRASTIIEDGLNETGENEILLWGLGYINWYYFHMGIFLDEKYLQKAKSYAEKVFNLNDASSYGYQLQGMICQKRFEIKEAIINFQKALEINPNNAEALDHIIWLYAEVGKTDRCHDLFERLLTIDPLTSHNHWAKGYTLLLEGKFEKCLPPFVKAYELEIENGLWLLWYVYALLLNNRHKEAIEVLAPYEKETTSNLFINLTILIKCAFLNDHTKAFHCLSDEIFAIMEWSAMGCLWLAQSFSLLDEKDRSLDWLEKTIEKGLINYPFLSEYDHTLENIRGEERFRKLMKNVKHKWANFEV